MAHQQKRIVAVESRFKDVGRRTEKKTQRAAVGKRDKREAESGGCGTRTARARWREYHQDGCYGSSGIHIACRGNYVKLSVFPKCKCKSRHGASFLHIRSVPISEVSSRCILRIYGGAKVLVGHTKGDHAQAAGGHLAMSAERSASWQPVMQPQQPQQPDACFTNLY